MYNCSGMTTFLMTWNPDSSHGWGHDALTREALKPFKKLGYAELTWRIAPPYTARTGDPFVLLKQGKRPTGIFGTGEITTPPKFIKDAMRVKIRFSHLTDPALDFFLSEMEAREILGDSYVNSRRSGRALPEDRAERLHEMLALRL